MLSAGHLCCPQLSWRTVVQRLALLPPGAHHSAANPQPLQDILHPCGPVLLDWSTWTASHTGQSGNTAVTKFFALKKYVLPENIMPAPHGPEAVFRFLHGLAPKGLQKLGVGRKGDKNSSSKCASLFAFVGYPSHLL